MRTGNGCVIYTRVSSSEQAANNGSLETQKRLCEDYAYKHQFLIKKYFGGTYESAKSDERKHFKLMLDYVRRNKDVKYIVVQNYDRFSRTGAEASRLSAQLRKEGIILKSVTMNIDSNTASGIMQEDIMHLLNNFDNNTKSERTKLNTREVMLKGYWPYAPPLGYKNLKRMHRACFHEYVITEEGKELKKAFLLKAEGKLTNKEIVALIKSRGLDLTDKNFRNVISNPFYAGYVTGKLLNGKLVKGKHPALVDLKTFMKANEALNEAPMAGVPKVFRHEEIPLKIFAKDEISGQPLTGYCTKNNWYYKIKAGDKPVNVSAKKLNGMFSDYLLAFEYQKKYKQELKRLMLKNLKERMSQSLEVSKLLKKKIAEKQSQLDSVEEKFVLSDITKEVYQKYMLKYQQELAVLKTELSKGDLNSSNLEKAVEKCLHIAENISESWSSASFENKRLLQNLVFPIGILYDKKNETVRTERVNSLFGAIEPLKRIIEENKEGNPEKDCLQSTLVRQRRFELPRP
ncbi:MAG: recombinase family protein [Bacteroidota bacterium]